MRLPSIFNKGRVTRITAINVKLQGFTHALKGMESKGETIDIDIPFKNKVHVDMLTEAGVFKAEKGKPMRIDKITVAEPFQLVETVPKAPVEVPSGGQANFRITVKPPGHSYTGPLSISFASEPVEMVHIEITRTVMDHKGKRTEIAASSKMLNIEKGKIFTEKVQLYKVMGFNESANSMSVSFPFKLVSTDPKLPTTIDSPNSYIIALYIQAPQQNYSGELVVTIE